MILSGEEIRRRLGKTIIIEPFDQKQLNPNSYNLKIYPELLVYREEILDMKKENPTDKLNIPPQGLILEPNKLYLARTLEYTETLDSVPVLEGRSSVGRLGLAVHITAGFGDVGFCGYWTLELSCLQPVKIYPEVKICQITYHTIEGSYQHYQSEKYQNSRNILASKLFKEFGA